MPLWIIAKYEVLRMFRMRYVMAIQFVMPLLLIFILGSALSGAFKVEDRTLKPVKVDVVQGDSGALKSSIEGFLHSPDLGNLIHTSTVQTRDQAVKRLKSGTSEFALIIPADFSARVMAGKEAEWEMIFGNNYEQNLTAEMVLRSFLDNVNQRQAIAIAAGSEAAAAMQNQGSSEHAAAPAASHVKLGNLATNKSQYSAMQYYAASMLVMFLLYSGLSTAMTLQGEKDKHTLSRLNAMPIHESTILLGKVLGNAFIAICQAAVIVGTTVIVYHVDWGKSYGLLALICIFVVIASMSLAVLTALIVKSSKGISTIFQMVVLTMSFLSGGFTPLPDGFLRQIGDFTLNYWAMQSMYRIMLGSEASVLAHHLLVLGCISGGLLLVSFIVYRKAGYHE
ncbi:ABC transporter permease [Paenibacillus chondroitinus]|uniref:ABC transporter permease n=1 Tax=Paenibacillus chondroitinus TaxID=59842 RepID=A0ABU6D730_9BACL|nr:MULTISPECIES: ABC transporter permease [Paenibacillus]MCY9658279.1 ABC transporter permease [Paenibacillus anseongense]MEB4792722.1 ABC transporter permease [Paenibacillus chondroitinus]